MKRVALFLAGLPLAWLGLLGVPLTALAILDPVGAKAADDADPFGIPPTLTESVTLLLVYLAVGIVGFYLCYRGLFPPYRPPGRAAA